MFYSGWIVDPLIFLLSTNMRPTLTKYFPRASAVLCGVMLACRHVKLRCEHLKSCCQCSFADYRLSVRRRCGISINTPQMSIVYLSNKSCSPEICFKHHSHEATIKKQWVCLFSGDTRPRAILTACRPHQRIIKPCFPLGYSHQHPNKTMADLNNPAAHLNPVAKVRCVWWCQGKKAAQVSTCWPARWRL